MANKIKQNGKSTLPAVRLFLAGFCIGCLIPNIAWKLEWRQKTIASLYLLGTFAEKNISKEQLLFQILRLRGSYFLLAFLSGFSIFGMPFAIIAMLLTGIGTGIIITMSILQFGLPGGAVGAGLLFPHYLVYLPVSFWFMSAVYEQSMDVWKNRGLFSQRSGAFISCFLVAGLLTSVGMIAEAYINPWVTELLLKTFRLF